MAALQLRAPRPAAVAAASRISRPFHGAMNVAHPLGRRGPSPAPVKLQACTRDSFRSHCEKRADRFNEPDPEPENLDPDKKQKNHPLVEELLNYKQSVLAAMGVRVPPDMFLKEKERISDYEMKLRSAHSRTLDERVMATIVCSRAQQALDLASKVMDIVRVGPGTIKFSQHTTDQAWRPAIYHILVQGTVAKLKDGHLKNKITHHMDTHSQEFYKKVNSLEDKVARLKEQELQRMVTTMLLYGLEHASLYIFHLTEGRKLALDYLTS